MRPVALAPLVLYLALAACGDTTTTDDADLAVYLTRVARLDEAARAKEIASWRFDRTSFEKVVVVPFQSLWPAYATHFDELAPAFVAKLDHGGTIVARRHFADDPTLTPSQARLRWALPVQFPSMVAELDGQPLDTVFVRDGSHWRALAGLDEEVLARVRALDTTCGERLATAGPPTPCTQIAWVVADAALRGQAERFGRACQLAATSCPLHGP